MSTVEADIPTVMDPLDVYPDEGIDTPSSAPLPKDASPALWIDENIQPAED